MSASVSMVNKHRIVGGFRYDLEDRKQLTLPLVPMHLEELKVGYRTLRKSTDRNKRQHWLNNEL